MTIEERMEFVLQSIESHDRQIGENTSQIGENASQIGEIERKLVRLEDAIEKLVVVSNEDATAIRALARIAEAHEKRIFEVEGNR